MQLLAHVGPVPKELLLVVYGDKHTLQDKYSDERLLFRQVALAAKTRFNLLVSPLCTYSTNHKK